jgi:predicted MFS family arabinose efflux permease
MASVPHLPSLLAWSLFGRLHMTGTPIAITFLVAGWTGSYALAGTISALLTAGVAVAGPLRGRAADRQPATRLLVITGVGYGIGLAALAFLPGAVWPAALLIAPLTGLFMPPVSPLGRATWPRIATGAARTATYTAESTLQELLFVVGPTLTATAVALVSARAALLGCGAVAVAGAVGFGLALRRAGLDAPVAAEHGAARRNPFTLFAVPGLARLLVGALLIVAGLSAIDLVIVAWSRDRGTPALAGVLAAVWAIGSLSGGLLSGLATRPPHLSRRLGAMALSTALIVPTLPPILHSASPVLVGAVLMVGGTMVAPALAANMSRIGDVAPPDRRGEVFGWVSTVSTAGAAVSAPLTGWLVDGYGPAVAVAAGVAFAVVAAVLSLGRTVAPRRAASPGTGS